MSFRTPGDTKSFRTVGLPIRDSSEQELAKKIRNRLDRNRPKDGNDGTRAAIYKILQDNQQTFEFVTNLDELLEAIINPRPD